MTLPSRWDSLDQIPEWAKGSVVERDGKFFLDVAGYAPKETVDEFRENNLRLKSELEALHGKLNGAVSAEDAARLQTEIETLRARLEAGEDDKRVQELVQKRIAPVKIGDREVLVDRAHKAVVESVVAGLSKSLSDAEEARSAVAAELARERIEGGTRRALSAIGGYKDAAVDDIVLHVAQRFRMGDDYQPYLPDPNDKEGKLAAVGADGKPVSIESYLRGVREKGTKSGVWFDEPRGPRQVPRGAPASSQANDLHGVSRIRAGLEKLGTFSD